MFLPLPFLKVLTAIVTALIAVLFLYYASQLKKKYEEQLSSYDSETKGTVFRQWKKEVPLDSGEISTVWYVDYQYTVDGTEYNICSDIGHYKKMFADGREVTIRYKKPEPSQIYVPEENGSDKTAFHIIFVLGFIVIGIGVLLQILLAIRFGV